MKLSIENLKRGITWWQQGKWPSDYHNHEYFSIYQGRASGLTEQWLILTIDRLAKWHAIRSRKPPNTKVEIGDFITLSFDPQSGHEQKGRRPAPVFRR